MICSSRAQLPQAYNKNGELRQNRWVSLLVLVRFSEIVLSSSSLSSCSSPRHKRVRRKMPRRKGEIEMVPYLYRAPTVDQLVRMVAVVAGSR